MRAYELTQTKAMRKLAVAIWPTPKALTNHAKLDEVIRLVSDSGYHPCGTIPMGIDSDPMAVVDERCYVRGVRGLQVADASIFPTVPSCNIHLPSLMVGERAADFIKEDQPV